MSARIAFLFLGPATHIDHAASIACELHAIPGHEVSIFVSTDLNRQTFESAASFYPHRPVVQFLQPSRWHRFLRLFKKRLHPRVSAMLAHNAARLRQFDALTVTVPRFIKRKGRRPLMIFADHGAGDRAQGFASPRLAEVDLFLVSGQAKWERMERLGFLSADRAKVTGYAKFDLAHLRAGQRKPLFDNGNPVVLYNPHYQRRECSWPRWGTDVLDFFVANPHLNLVFAPHMLLFSKETGALDPKYYAAKNIHIDLDSPALSDMTYTSTADVYLGDVSSQVYEFAAYRNRPCLFLNAHAVEWREDENFRMWKMGRVLDDLSSLPEALATAQNSFAEHADAQRLLVAETFSITEVPAGRRAAQAIAEFLAAHP